MADSDPLAQPTETQTPANLTLVQETPVIETVAAPGGDVTMQDAEKVTETTRSDQKWDADKMLAAPIEVAQIVWKTTDAQGSTLSILPTATGKSIKYPRIPYDFLQQNVQSMQTNILKSYTYLRYHTRFQFQPSSTMFNCGELWIGILPIQDSEDYDGMLSNDMKTSYWQHIIIDPSEATDHVLDVPFFHPQTMLNNTFDDPYNRGYANLFAYVYVPLQVPASATTSITINVLMSLPGTLYTTAINPALTYLSPKPPTSFYDDDEEWIRVPKKVVRDVQNVVDTFFRDSDDEGPHRGETHGNSVGSLAKSVSDTVSNVTDGIGKVFSGDFEGAIGDVGQAVQNGMAAVDQGMEFAAMLDRPVHLKSQVNVIKQTGPQQFGIGSDTSSRISISPYDLFFPDFPALAEQGKLYSIKELCARRTVLASIPWSTSDAAFKNIYTINMRPADMRNGGRSYFFFFASIMSYWRAHFSFFIKVICSRFHAGKLAVVYANGYYGPAPTYSECKNWSRDFIDLSNTTTRTHECKFPYTSAYEYLTTNYYNGNVGTQQHLASLGQVFIFVLVPLQATEGVATNITIKMELSVRDAIFASPKSTYRFNTATDGSNKINPLSVTAPLTQGKPEPLPVATTTTPATVTPVTVTNPTDSPIPFTWAGSSSGMPVQNGASAPFQTRTVVENGISEPIPLGVLTEEFPNKLLTASGQPSSRIVGGAYLEQVPFGGYTHAGRDDLDLKDPEELLNGMSVLRWTLEKLKTQAAELKKSAQVAILLNGDDGELKPYRNFCTNVEAQIASICERAISLSHRVEELVQRHKDLIGESEPQQKAPRYFRYEEKPDDGPPLRDRDRWTEEDMKPHEGETHGDTTRTIDSTADMQLGSAKAPINPGHFALHATDDIRDLMRAYTLFDKFIFSPTTPAILPTGKRFNNTFALTSGVSIQYAVNPTGYDLVAADNRCALISQIFLGWSGSLRFKMICANNLLDNFTVRVTHFPDLYASGTNREIRDFSMEATGYTTISYTMINPNVIEFEVPFRAQTKFLWRANQAALPDRWYSDNGVLQISFNDSWKTTSKDRQQDFDVTLLMAAGDDYHLFYPIPPPTFAVGGDNIGIGDQIQLTTTTATTTTTTANTLTTTMSKTVRPMGQTLVSSSTSSHQYQVAAPVPRMRSPENVQEDQRSLASRVYANSLQDGV